MRRFVWLIAWVVLGLLALFLAVWQMPDIVRTPSAFGHYVVVMTNDWPQDPCVLVTLWKGAPPSSDAPLQALVGCSEWWIRWPWE